jgi:hypothetical protein
MMERHWGQRRSTNVAVQFFTRPDATGTGRVVNISSTGAFMETQSPLRILSLLYLEPTDQPSVNGTSGRIAATVVRHDATGVGLKWCEFAAETTKVYARLAAGSTDLADAQQLWLPVIPDGMPVPVGDANSPDRRSLYKLEFVG